MNKFIKYIKDSLPPHSFFDHILDDLPHVRGLHTVYFFAFTLLITGCVLAYYFDSAWISGFGNLISITAIYFAYARPIHDRQVFEWIDTTIIAINENAQLVFELNNPNNYIKDEEVFSEFMKTFYAPVSTYTLSQLAVVVNPALGAKITYVDCLMLLNKIKSEDYAVINLTKNLNSSLYKTELIVGCLGLFVNGFGSILIDAFKQLPN